MIICIFFILFFLHPFQVSAASEESVSLFCTSNKDGTGSCFDESGRNQFECLIVPGTIIPCKNLVSGGTIWCVYIGDSQFNCMEKKDSLLMQEVSPRSLNSNLDVIPESIFQGDNDLSSSLFSE